MSLLVKYATKVGNIFFAPPLFSIILPLVWVLDVSLSICVLFKVAYTEIDWVAYMQQVEIFLNGTLDYDQLNGETGPCVYPAGHIYIYSLLYLLTDQGKNIFKAQCIFAILYAFSIALVFNIYRKFKQIPLLLILILSFASYRVHSIYLLRLFNDTWAMLLLHGSLNCCLYNHFTFAAILFSCAVGIKMNILLFAPGFLLVLLKHQGVYETIGHLAECGIIQVLLGAIFLFRNSEAYFYRAFEFSRQFMYKWTVNWRVIPEELFLDRRFHVALLVLHVLVLSFFLIKFIRSRGGFKKFCHALPPPNRPPINADDVLYPMFVANFIGIAFSRSLHYQFYVWYYHSIPYLLWSAALVKDPVRYLIFGLIEMCWNVYPSTVLSSMTLHICHVIIILGLALQHLKVAPLVIKETSKGRKRKQH